MLAEQNEIFDECATTLTQLKEDEKIRMQCKISQKTGLSVGQMQLLKS